MNHQQKSLALVDQALAEIKKGRMVILTDDEDRENEGDLVIAAQKLTPRRSTSWPRTAAASSACRSPSSASSSSACR